MTLIQEQKMNQEPIEKGEKKEEEMRRSKVKVNTEGQIMINKNE